MGFPCDGSCLATVDGAFFRILSYPFPAHKEFSSEFQFRTPVSSWKKIIASDGGFWIITLFFVSFWVSWHRIEIPGWVFFFFFFFFWDRLARASQPGCMKCLFTLTSPCRLSVFCPRRVGLPRGTSIALFFFLVFFFPSHGSDSRE
jgi:hypothetical protein